jgi:hypothetical protein
MIRLLIPALLLLISSHISENKIQQPPFTDGVIYSRTLFPDHPINKVLQRMDFTAGQTDNQFRSLCDSLGIVPRNLDDPMYMGFIFLLPVYSETYFEKEQAYSRQFSLGYLMEATLKKSVDSGTLYIGRHAGPENIKLDFKLPSMDKVWEKYQIDSDEYAVAGSKETKKIAGYTCTKTTYSFNGTSRQPPMYTKLVAKIPWSITTWSTNDLDPEVNVQLPFKIKNSKAILRMDVEFEKDHSKKMIWEVTRIQPKQLKPEDLNQNDNSTYIHYEDDPQKAVMDIMTVIGATLGGM